MLSIDVCDHKRLPSLRLPNVSWNFFWFYTETAALQTAPSAPYSCCPRSSPDRSAFACPATTHRKDLPRISSARQIYAARANPAIYVQRLIRLATASE